MAIKSRATLNSDADTNINDNSAGEISAADVRDSVKDLADSTFNLTTDDIADVPGAGSAAAEDTSAFATAAQGTTADAALPKAGGEMSGNITMAGAETVDGRDLSVDGTKLDGIEVGADVTDAANVNAAGAVMESDYNAQTVLIAVSDNTPSPVTIAASNFVGRKATGDAGVMSASEARTVLNVEDGATADQSAAEILAALLTVDGSGSGLDADLLDGNSSAAFALAGHDHVGVYQPADADLDALAALNATGGMLARTGAGTFAVRTLAGTANQITMSNGDGVADAPTVSLPADVIIPTVLTVPNTGLHLLDTNASHDLIVKPGSDLAADRTLTVTTGDADRTLTISGNATVSQDYSTTGNPQFASIEVGHATQNTLTGSGGNLSVEGNLLYRAGGTDVPVTDGGTGASTAAAGFAALAAASIAFTGDISPAQITSDQNNYAPTGHADATIWRLDSDAIRTITGIAGGTEGRVIILLNVGSFPINLEDSGAGSTDANKIRTVDFGWTAVPVQGAVILQYDGTTSRWYVIADRPTRALQNGMEGAAGFNYVTAGAQQWHPGHPKVWVQGTPNSTTIITSYNVASLGDTNTGQQTVTIATDFSSVNYCVQVTVGDTSTALVKSATVMTKAAGTYIMNSVVEAGSGSDPSSDWNSVGFGDQA